MRPYRNISDSELESFKAVRDWNKSFLLTLSIPTQILWIHSSREKFHRLDPYDPCLIRIITIERIQGDVIKTNFGSYSTDTGKNIFYACGCKKFCDCYGQLYLLSQPNGFSE